MVINRYDDLCGKFTLNKESKARLDKLKSLERLQSLRTNEARKTVAQLENALENALSFNSEPRKIDDLIDSLW